MQHSILQDDIGTHISWLHQNISATMIDWFWSNMEKCFLLWHPSEHEPLQWAIPVTPTRFVGAVHIAPQTWSDGLRQNLYIRFEDLKNLPDEVKQHIEFEHCVVVAGLGFGTESLNTPEPLGYRLHQWQETEMGVTGKSSAVGWRKKETAAEGLVWAKHCIEEIGNWAVFLPQIHHLYAVVKNQNFNPLHNLTVLGKGTAAQYKFVDEVKA